MRTPWTRCSVWSVGLGMTSHTSSSVMVRARPPVLPSSHPLLSHLQSACAHPCPEHILKCGSGCDSACHTYCANLPGIPEEAWFCAACERRPHQPTRRSQRCASAVQPTTPAAGRTDQGAELRQGSSTAAAAPGSEGRAGRRQRASVAADMGVSSPIDLTLSASPEAPRPRRRRLQRMSVLLPGFALLVFWHRSNYGLPVSR